MAKKALNAVTPPSNVLTEDQQAALFFQHKNKVIALREKLASVNGELRAALKVAKSDGFTKKEIDFAIELEKDDAKIVAWRKRQEQIAIWEGLPLGTQTELDLTPPVDRRPIEERAAAEGKRDGMKGGSLVPPYAQGAPGYEEYVEGWHLGAAALFSIQNRQSDTELLRPESDDEGQDDFDAAVDSDFGDDSYRPSDEVDVGGDDADFEPPAFLRDGAEAREDA